MRPRHHIHRPWRGGAGGGDDGKQRHARPKPGTAATGPAPLLSNTARPDPDEGPEIDITEALGRTTGDRDLLRLIMGEFVDSYAGTACAATLASNVTDHVHEPPKQRAL